MRGGAEVERGRLGPTQSKGERVRRDGEQSYGVLTTGNLFDNFLVGSFLFILVNREEPECSCEAACRRF
jgi:hypothetical protein